jgi:hypothetical protein
MVATHEDLIVTPAVPDDHRSTEGRWRPLSRIAGFAALIAAIATPITIAVFALWPPPYEEGVERWFELLSDNPLLGLMSLDLAFLIVNVLMIPVMLALYVVLRRHDVSLTTLAIVTFFVGLAAYLTTNPAIEMWSLSQSYGEATTEVERVTLLGAGEALMSGFEGTAFHVNYILAQAAGILLGVVMLRAGAFTRSIAWLMIVGNAVGFGLYIPVVGLGLSAFAGVILWIWMILLARAFFRIDEDGYLFGTRGVADTRKGVSP